MSRKLLNLCLAMLMSMVCTAAWALSEVGGVYQIGTADDLVAFAELVNGDNPYAHAVLTADIEKPSTDVSMIGRDGQDFQGIFDGAGHTITINLFSQGENGTALFRNVGVHGVIQNLKVQGTITTDKKFAAGIAAWSSGIIRGCYIDVNVVSAMAGDATHGGLVGVADRGTVIENCLAKFTITGATTQNCGGLIGWTNNPVTVANSLVISDGSSFDLSNGGSSNIARNGGNMRVVNLKTYNEDPYANRASGANYNNYVTNQWGDNNATTVVAYEDLADGRICYQLNNDQSEINWVQTIGTDPFPVPAAFGTGRVYASAATDCDGKSEAEAELTFSNSGSDQATKHAFDKWGMCPVCGCFNFNGLEHDTTDNTWLLKSADDVYVAEGWNRIGDGFKVNMKMANDIEINAEPNQYIFNTGNWVDGNFNGDGHTLTIVMDIDGSNASFIPQFSGTFENVIMHGTIKTTGQYAGSVTSHSQNSSVKIRNVFSDITFNSTHVGDNTTGGFIGVAETRTEVENSIYAGDINGIEGSTCLAGLCGWATGQTYFTNCAFIGNLVNPGGDSKNISRNPGNVFSDNVYVVNETLFHNDKGEDITDYGKYTLFESGGEGIESGELAFYLNGKQNGVERFYQLIGTDPEPMPIKKDGALVYASAASYQCDGTPVSAVYQNTPAGEPVIPPHDFEDGFCQNCGSLDENFLTPVDGWYEISNGAELLWWSHYASKHLDASAKLTADIDMNGYSNRWADVGTRERPFYGNFDGQFHIISNFVVNKPSTDGVGLIAVMNSLPSAGFGGISDTDARNAEGVYIQNVVLDESCTLTGHGYVALVGMTAPWAGHVKIKGVMMCGDVTSTGGANAAGVFGCVMSSTCHVTIDNCGMVGNVYGSSVAENGSFSGWLGSYADVTNCFALGTVENTQSDDRYFARLDGGSSNVHINNCYARYGTQVPIVNEEDFVSGALAWRANGEQFRTSYWYQTIGDDAYPFPDPSHGTVIFAAEQYFSVVDEADIEEVAPVIEAYELGLIEELIATQDVMDACTEAINILSETTTILELADALDTLNVKKAELIENAAIYQAYFDKCEEIKARLESDDSFQGELRDALVAYLEDYEEPSDENPLGTYDYIKTNHTATAAEVAAETERVIKWLADAIAEDYQPGTDISNLIPNSDFSNGKEGWTGGWSTGTGNTIKDAEGKTVVGVEAWNVTGDQYQTIADMKPGYYLVGTHAAFRPSNNRYSTNYAAGIYANGIFNYFPTVIEDPVSVDDAEDQVNCNLTGAGAHDLAIYEDGISTEGEDGIVGYVVHGETGMAAAANADRYPVYTIAYVGEDGKLTIGIKNPGTHYSNDWTGWSALKVTYCGDDEDQTNEALDLVLENMVARAETILAYQYDDVNTDANAGPNFPQALRDQLDELIGAVDGANTVEAKAALAKDFSDTFQAVYDGKRAYVTLFAAAEALASFEMENLPLIEYDEELEDWVETGELVFSDDETELTFSASDEMHEAYENGAYTTEEALAAIDAIYNSPDFAGIMPQKDQDGYYLIGTVKELVAFRAMATSGDNTIKGKLVADIDMAGVGMQPINTKDYRFRGTLDGQNHAITNLFINHESENTGLFGAIDAATVKNIKVAGQYHSGSKYIGGITGYSYGNSRINNCDVEVEIYSTIEGDGTHGGIVGVNETAGLIIENCLINCPMFGESTDHCGGVIGWSTAGSTVRNTLILSQGHTVGSNESNTISRNPDNCTVSNVFYVTQLGTAAGTKVTPEQLASGEITWKLNGSQGENVAWFQTLGVDATPHLFGDDIVYFYGGQYINEKPNPQLNAFAFNLDANLVGENVVVTFNRNAEAEAAEVRFSNCYTMPVQVSGAGSYRAMVPASELGDDPTALTYEVAVTGKGTLDVVKVGDSYKFTSPYGLTVNNNPASKGFGQVLITETRPGDDYSGMFSADAPGALFAFDADFQPVGSYYGGLDVVGGTPLIIGGDYQFDLKDIRFSKDGRLFIGRASGTSNSSVWEINPDNLEEDWKPLFTGGELDEATGITYVGDEEQNRMAVGLAVEGEGDALRLYVLGGQRSNGEYNTTDYNCAFYDLGTATEWSAAPSGYVAALDGVYTIAPGHVGIHEDGQGGLWYVQYRSAPTELLPSIKHFDAEGNEDYSNTTTSTNSGKMAVTSDGKYIALPQGSGKVVIYETNYVPMANGKIFLDPKYNISVSEGNITGLAFDYANNLYATSSSTKTLSRYAIPSWHEGAVVTPGNAIGTGGDGDANSDGVVDIADVTYVLTLMARNGYEAKADVNGDGTVDIADVTNILTIMASQEQ